MVELAKSLHESPLPAGFETMPESLDPKGLIVGQALFDVRRIRALYLDDDAGSDGAFSTMLAMYLDTARGMSTPIARIVAAADVPLSTALYILDVLIEAGQINQIGRLGRERYALTSKAERTMRRYLAHAFDELCRAGRKLR